MMLTPKIAIAVPLDIDACHQTRYAPEKEVKDGPEPRSTAAGAGAAGAPGQTSCSSGPSAPSSG